MGPVKTNLLDLNFEQLSHFFSSIGEASFRAQQVMQWVHQMGEKNFDAMSNMAQGLRGKLKELACIEAPSLLAEQKARDGTRKWLLDVGVGNGIETVFIPEKERGTLCISSQVGCALTCTFCSTGRQGFNRNLTTAEMIGQLWWANRALGVTHKKERLISNVVLMGMGEPLANFDHVVAALHIMLSDYAYGLSRRRVTLSTSGLVPQIDRLAQACPVALAVSLHAPNDELRDQIVPINRKYPLNTLIAACQRYLAYAPRDYITFEYVMLNGVNDKIEHAQQLISLARAVSCKINLIPFNRFPHSGYRQSSQQNLHRFRDLLQEAGFIVTIRKTRGADIDAACGQLAGVVHDRRPVKRA